MRIIRLGVLMKTPIFDRVPEMGRANSTARICLVTNDNAYRNHRPTDISVPSLQTLGAGEAVEILLEKAVDPDRAEMKQLQNV